jgi:hypothetical protein
MTMYKNNISNYDTEEGKVTRTEIEDAKAAIKNIDAEIAAGDAAADGNSADPDLDDLLSGNITTTPSWPEQRHSLLRSKQKVNDYLDKLYVKLDKECEKAKIKLAAEIKPQVDSLEKQIIDAAVALYELQLDHFTSKRSFLSNGIGTYGNFSSTIDDVLGVPTNNSTAIARLFHEAVKKGQLKSMPAGIRDGLTYLKDKIGSSKHG